MTLTNNIRSLILNRLRELKMNQSEFAERCGKKKAWGSKFFGGQIAAMSDELTDKVEEILGIELVQVTRQGRVSQDVLEMAAAMEDNPHMRAIAHASLALYKGTPQPPQPRKSKTNLGGAAMIALVAASAGLLIGQMLSEPQQQSAQVSPEAKQELKDELLREIAELHSRRAIEQRLGEIRPAQR